MQFGDVIGQKETKQHLAEMVEQNRLSHALLFLGKEGSGALPLAMAFAQYIVSLPQPAPVVEDLFGGMTALEPTCLLIFILIISIYSLRSRERNN
jgi:DNA polymerase-3 subunit delta'